MPKDKVVEFRGCDNLVAAEVLTDSSEGYTTGEVFELAALANVSKTVSSDSAQKYYDNVVAISITQEGSDEVTFAVPALSLPMSAKLTGKSIDAETGALLDSGSSEEKYFAVGYRIKKTDHTYRYIWKLKGTFSVPNEESKTEDDSTDSNGQELTYTSFKTIHRFTKNNKSCKNIVIDESDDLCDLSGFFEQVQTPDTVSELKKVTPGS